MRFGSLTAVLASALLLSFPSGAGAADPPSQTEKEQPTAAPVGQKAADKPPMGQKAADKPPMGQKAADKPPKDETTAARELFVQGVDMADRAKWAEAAQSFRLSLALRPSPVTAYNLASALCRLGSVVEAAQILRGVVWDRTANHDVRAAARQLLETTMPRVGWLTVRLLGDARDVRVTIDHDPSAFPGFGIPAPLDPGRHSVTVHRFGHQPARRDVQIEEHGSHHVLLDVPTQTLPDPAELERLSAAGDSDPGAERGDDGNVLQNPWFWAAPGALVVGAIVIGVLWANSN